MISISQADLLNWLEPILWPFLRVLALFTAAPILSSRAVPVRLRIGLALLVTLCAQASIAPSALLVSSSGRELTLVAQQLVIGFALGFSVRLLLATFELAGELVGFQSGLNFAAFFDPTSSSQTSGLGRFFGLMATLMLVTVDGHLLLLLAITRSFELFPVGQPVMQALSRIGLLQLGSAMFASALWIALPMIGVLLFVNLSLGMVSRVAPQLNLYAIGFPITLLTGLGAVALSLPLLDQAFTSLLARLLLPYQ